MPKTASSSGAANGGFWTPKGLLAFGACAAAAFLALAFFGSLAPYNMDEFIHYDAIACHLYPGNSLHGTCDPFMLDFLGTGWVLPLRAYHYSGSFPALYYLPIHLLWNSPLAARMLGLVFLLLGAGMCARIFRLPRKFVVPPMLLCFPYLFQHLVDTGPVGFHILSVFLIYFCLDEWLATLRWRWVPAIALIVVCGLWTKFSYAWYAPGFACFFLIHFVRHRALLRKRKKIRRLLLQALAAAALIALPIGALLWSSAPGNPADHPYLGQLLHSETFTPAEIAHGVWKDSGVTYSLLHPLEATQRIFEVEPAPAASAVFSAVTFLFTPLTLLLLALRRKSAVSRRALLLPAALYGVFLLTVLMILRTKGAGLMHHSVLSYPFLWLSVFAALRAVRWPSVSARWSIVKIWLLCVLGAFLAINMFFFARFPLQHIRFNDQPEKLLAHAIINTGSIPRKFMVLTLDWGMFYYSGLFGSPDKSVVFAWGLKDADGIRRYRDIAAEDGRKLLFLYTREPTSTDLAVVRSTLPVEPCSAFADDAEWQMLAEPDAELERACDTFRDAYDSRRIDHRPLLRMGLAF
jgi:hypothetical protein